jgi:hypothetical protein
MIKNEKFAIFFHAKELSHASYTERFPRTVAHCANANASVVKSCGERISPRVPGDSPWPGKSRAYTTWPALASNSAG